MDWLIFGCWLFVWFDFVWVDSGLIWFDLDGLDLIWLGWLIGWLFICMYLYVCVCLRAVSSIAVTSGGNNFNRVRWTFSLVLHVCSLQWMVRSAIFCPKVAVFNDRWNALTVLEISPGWCGGMDVDRDKLLRQVIFANFHSCSYFAFWSSTNLFNSQNQVSYISSNFVRFAFGKGVVKQVFPKTPQGSNFVGCASDGFQFCQSKKWQEIRFVCAKFRTQGSHGIHRGISASGTDMSSLVWRTHRTLDAPPGSVRCSWFRFNPFGRASAWGGWKTSRCPLNPRWGGGFLTCNPQ